MSANFSSKLFLFMKEVLAKKTYSLNCYRHALKGYKGMIPGRSTALDSTLIIGIVLTNA